MRAEPNLKLLILYDAEDNEYAVVEHNLAADVATGRAVQMREQHIPAFAVEQSTRHKTLEPATAKPVSATCATGSQSGN